MRPFPRLLAPFFAAGMALVSCEGEDSNPAPADPKTVDTVIYSGSLAVAASAATTTPVAYSAVFDPSANSDVSSNLGKIHLVNTSSPSVSCAQLLSNGNPTLTGTWSLHLDPDPAGTTYALGAISGASLDAAVRTGDALPVDRGAVSAADRDALQQAIGHGTKGRVTFTGTVSGPCQAYITFQVPTKLTLN
jgi:hypothetical protein